MLLGFSWSHLFLRGGFVRDFIESFLRVSDVPGTEVLALPLAYAAGSIIGTLVLIVLFERTFGGFLRGIGRVCGEAMVAGGVGGAATYGALAALGELTDTTTFSLLLIHGFVAGVVGLVAIILTYMLMRSQELEEMHQALRSKLVAKARIVVSTEDELA
jgi:hypothetical protein